MSDPSLGLQNSFTGFSKMRPFLNKNDTSLNIQYCRLREQLGNTFDMMYLRGCSESFLTDSTTIQINQLN